MTRTQILIPDVTYGELKAYADVNELSLAEVIRRSFELFVRAHRAACAKTALKKWRVPVVDGARTLEDPFDRPGWRADLVGGRGL